MSEKKFNWCLEQGQKSGKHRGLRKTSPSQEKPQKHIAKALHNLKAFDHNKDEFPDWAVSAAFYAMYHAFLALLFKLGYESRNQECTISTIEYFIESKRIELDRKYVEMIRRTSELIPKDAKLLREEFQYGTAVSVDAEVLNSMRKNAVEFVEAVQICLENL